MNHTPGPWKINKHDKYSHYYGDLQASLGGRNIRTVGLVLKYAEAEENEANANLIEAAPELLEALEEMYEKCNVSPDDAPHRVKARAAIAKARGES